MPFHKRLEAIATLALFAVVFSFTGDDQFSLASPTLKADKAKFDPRSSKPLQGHAAYKPIQGGVSLSLTLPPTPATLHQGAVFKKENIPKTPKVTDWYLIPTWFAGSWHRETMTEVFPIEMLGDIFGLNGVHLERADHLWGHQVDRLGGIWQHRVEPYIQTVEMENVVSTKTVTLQEPVLVSDSKVIIHYRDITVNFSKTDHTILSTHQHEQVSQLTRNGSLLVEDVRDKNFDENGKCLNEGHAKTVYTLTQAFQPIDIDIKTKQNLKEDFMLYLRVHNYLDRLPETTPANQPLNR